MIKIKYYGRLGNNLGQYCTGRILAERYGLCLCARPVKFFNNTSEKIDGLRNDKPEKSFVLRFNKVSLEDLDKKIGSCKNIRIGLKGTFAYYPIYKEHVNEIKKWLYIKEPSMEQLKGKFKILKQDSFSEINIDKINPDDLLVHVRLGDIVKNKKQLRTRSLLFDDYFGKLLPHIKFNRLFIITSEPESDHIKKFQQYNPICVFNTGKDAYIEDFKMFKLFNKIAMSRSSYAWWGAWLSNAKEIYFPLPFHSLWGETNIGTDANVIIDEDRFIYYRQKTDEILGNYKKAHELYDSIKLDWENSVIKAPKRERKKRKNEWKKRMGIV